MPPDDPKGRKDAEVGVSERCRRASDRPPEAALEGAEGLPMSRQILPAFNDCFQRYPAPTLREERVLIVRLRGQVEAR